MWLYPGVKGDIIHTEPQVYTFPMPGQKAYRKTLVACWLGFVTQAIAANYTPLLFLTFKSTYGIGLEMIALIPAIFYITQLLVDLAATRFVDRIGYRVCVVASQLLSAVGLALLTILPQLLPTPFVGILIAVSLYAIGSGLVEVLVSPIIEACPFDNKAGMMSLLHSFYCWGAVAVILGSTLFFSCFGVEHWRLLTLIWAIVPLYNALNFISCPINHPVENGKSMSVRELMHKPLFWLLIMLMACSGASEASMAQWASAFTESALRVSKIVGDLAGPCMFAVCMGGARVLYASISQKVNLANAMLLCGVLCVCCYLAASLASMPLVGLLGCALCGASVGMMWPGTLSISSQKCPTGGTAMFAILALAGDLGATISPAMVGGVAQLTGGDLKTGMLTATLFPLALIFILIILKIKFSDNHQTRVE